MSYRVTAGYVTAQTRVKNGRAYIDFPRGATLPSDVPAAETEWLLRSGQIEEIADVEVDESAEDSGAEESAEAGEAEEVVEDPELEDLEKDDLLTLAENEGVEIDKRWGVEKLAAAIREHRQ